MKRFILENRPANPPELLFWEISQATPSLSPFLECKGPLFQVFWLCLFGNISRSFRDSRLQVGHIPQLILNSSGEPFSALLLTGN